MNQLLPEPAPPCSTLALQRTASELAANEPSGRRDDPPARILVVDDNAGVLESFRKILCRGAGSSPSELASLEATLFGADSSAPDVAPRFDVDLVPDGKTGCDLVQLAVATSRPYAVAFVDMRMPGGWGGLETIEQLWRLDPAIQVVICTAYSDHAWCDVVAHLGRSDRLLILRKPFAGIEVLQLACALSQKWHLQRQQEARLTELEGKVEARVVELRRANRTLRMLSHCNETLVRARSEPELLQAICRQIVRVGGYRLAWVGYARHDEAKGVEPVAHAGTDEDYVHGLQLTWGDDEHRRGVGGTSIRDGRPAIARRIRADPLFTAWRDDALVRGFASCIALPLRIQDSVLGTLSIYSEAPDAFDAEEVKLLVELADDLGYGVASLRETEQRKRFELQLERQASFDSLTGLANRFTLEARVSQCLADARRHGNKAAMLLIDLDRLKLVNDTLGHAVGDRVLIEVARRLAGSVRESDTVARLGGDEFVVFM
jgi:GAF domain-containing protein/ActR/RegA family two-component response regulator